MQSRTLSRTGVQVGSLVLGAMNCGKLARTWQDEVSQDEVTAIVDAALEAGINLIDTAESTPPTGRAAASPKRWLAKPSPAIVDRREDIVLATTVYSPMSDGRTHPGSARRWLVTELDNSLQRINADHINRELAGRKNFL